MMKLKAVSLSSSILLVGSFACSEEVESTSPFLGGAPSVADPLYQCEETDFEVIVPLVGPGVTADGQVAPLDADSYVLHTTQLVVRPGAEGDAIQVSARIVGDATKIPGLVAMTAAGSESCGYLRTYGIWESEDAILSLMATPSHGEAVTRTAELALSTKLLSWQASREDAASFDWDAARAKAAEVEGTDY
jgi:hypothetical protein